jgi:hypothetical protein
MVKSFLILCFLLFATAPADAGPPSYDKILNRFTQSDEVYSTKNLKAAIQWTATIVNDELIEAQARHYARAYESSAEDKNKKKNELMKKKDGALLVVVAFYSGDKRFDDLTNEKSGWELRFQAGGVSFKPTRLKKMAKHPTPMDVFFYPHLKNNWTRGYYVWFSPEALFYAKPWSLSVFGPNAKSELVWK